MVLELELQPVSCNRQLGSHGAQTRTECFVHLCSQVISVDRNQRRTVSVLTTAFQWHPLESFSSLDRETSHTQT